ncbi:NUDIX domain-containing protein [Streptomyces sp. NPDC057580]|uniref:NUDIX domain-containing protein n=1 Tax=Streptomyces sp. NPDC057580 TaxID=3346173 RepID=UPI0036A04A7B
MPNNPPDEGNPVAQQTDNRPQALKPALDSMTLLVAAVIVHDKATNRVVLLQRSENAKFAQGLWDLPVGKSEPGEPITETAVRELYEETGLTVKPESLKVAHIIHGAWGVEAPNGFLTVVFAAHEWTGEPENREPRKHSQVRWVDAEAIPEPFVDTTASALRRYLSGGLDVSIQGWTTA